MAEVQLQSLVEALPGPVLVIGPDERILAANKAADALFATGDQGWHYITALRQPTVLDAIEATLADGSRRQTRYLGSEGGRDTTWNVTAAGLSLDGGTAVILTFEDMTAVEEAGQMRRDFVANVSHELRTPLTALVGFIETLRGPARDDAEARERFLGIMEAEAGRMARLLQDLLSLSKVEQEERVRPMDLVDLSDVLDETLTLLRPLGKTSGLRLDVDRPEGEIVVPGHAGQLRQVMRNLIENALKYGQKGDVVTIRLTGPAAEPALRGLGVRLVVQDEGEGIAAHHIARLTERFYRVDTHRSREVGGTGLGLAIVKHIVNRHRGRLRIESELGAGSSFTVILPTE